jgi:hypothetical protein
METLRTRAILALTLDALERELTSAPFNGEGFSHA